MRLRFWKELAERVRGLSPETIELEAERSFSLALVGTADELLDWTHRLVPAELGDARRDQASKRLTTIALPLPPAYARTLSSHDLCLVAPTGLEEVRQFAAECLALPANPDGERGWATALVEQIRERRPDLAMPLARHYWPLRGPVMDRIVSVTARENAAFAILSALPNIIPSPMELPWAIGEFASDTALITANQFRMAFLLAAACDAPVGWRRQKGQLASIAGSAFGFRALARELAGKIPAGGGLVAKGLIAFSATHALGRALEHFHCYGRHLTRAERRQAYIDAYRGGRQMVEDLARKIARRPRAASS